MIKESYDLLCKEYSGEKVKLLVEQIISFHRIQASPGFRAAAEYVAEILSESGLEVEIFKFPANEETSFWNYSSFQESAIDEAQLFLISEHSTEKIADYGENRLSVVQRSISTPINGIEAELVVLENGEKEEEYKKLQIKGKIVFSSGDINKVFSLAVQKYGAIGIITDRITEWPPIREKIDLPDALQYTSFWWYPGMRKCFGFVVSPRVGMRIRAQARTKSLKVRAVITSKLHNGTLEVLSAKIPGEAEEEILAVAHMCHPRPSANDNASGVCTLIETARVISALVRAGRIKKPRRTIRFLFVPEMTGTVAFLSNNGRIMRNIVAGLNLDMVGEDQAKCGSILMVDSTPLAFPTFVNAYVKYLFSFLPKDLKAFSSSEHFSSFRYAFVKFSGGSDHEILSDPTVNIPTSSFTNWPDKYYHTSEDTIEKVSPTTLWNVGAVAMTYIYSMANICSLDFAFLAALTEAYAEEKINTLYEYIVTTLYNLSQSNFSRVTVNQMRKWLFMSKFWTRWLADAINDIKRMDISKINELQLLSSFYQRKLSDLISLKDTVLREILSKECRKHGLMDIEAKSKTKSKIAKTVSKMIPLRLKPGPIDIKSRLWSIDDGTRKRIEELQKKPYWRLFSLISLYWVDGKRSIYDIGQMVEIEMGHCILGDLAEWLSILEKLNYIKISRL